jgi:hypothetical protein
MQTLAVKVGVESLDVVRCGRLERVGMGKIGAGRKYESQQLLVRSRDNLGRLL